MGQPPPQLGNYIPLDRETNHSCNLQISKQNIELDLSLHHASSQPNAVTCTKLVAGQQYCCLSCAQLFLPSQHAISCIVVKGLAVLNMLEKCPFRFLSMFKTIAMQVRLSPEKEEAGDTVWNRTGDSCGPRWINL